MAVQPLSPATDRRLGGLLPRQLPNRTQAHLRAASLWYKNHAIPIFHAVLATVSGCYSAPWGRLLTRYSPVRHWCIATPVRLECVMHAASVNPEPGSNSLKNCIISHLSMRHNLFRVFSDYLLLLCWVFSKSAFLISQENINEILSHLHVLKNFLCCSIFKEQVPTESRLSKSACLLYQILFHLSSIFEKVFLIFFKMYIRIKKFSTQKRLFVQTAIHIFSCKQFFCNREKKLTQIYNIYIWEEKSPVRAIDAKAFGHTFFRFGAWQGTKQVL